MRIFVYEYICGGGLAGEPLPESLRAQGWAMLTALLEDFSRCPGVETVTLLDSRLSATIGELSGAEVDLVEVDGEEALYRERTREADFTIVIAPDFDYLLYQRCGWTEAVDGRLLGPSMAAVHLTGDKFQLGEVWWRNGISTPPFAVFPEGCVDTLYPVVCKPRRGAGSKGLFLAHTLLELHEGRRRWQGFQEVSLIQPFVSGIPASVSLIIGGGQCLALPAAMQHLSDDGRFRYLGGSLPLSDALNDRAQRLALRAIAPIDGLSGYVGVDLILGAAVDGSEDVAIEINPRLTTSYVGLRALAEFNLAETMLALALGRPLPERRYRAGVVRFLADGTVEGPHVQ